MKINSHSLKSKEKARNSYQIGIDVEIEKTIGIVEAFSVVELFEIERAQIEIEFEENNLFLTTVASEEHY